MKVIFYDKVCFHPTLVPVVLVVVSRKGRVLEVQYSRVQWYHSLTIVQYRTTLDTTGHQPLVKAKGKKLGQSLKG